MSLEFKWEETSGGSRAVARLSTTERYQIEVYEGALQRISWRAEWNGAELGKGTASDLRSAKKEAELHARIGHARRRASLETSRRDCMIPKDSWERFDGDLLIYRDSSGAALWIWEGEGVWCGIMSPWRAHGPAPSVEEAKDRLKTLLNAANLLSTWSKE